MNYANIKKYDISNGMGVRVSLFVSGCKHYCKGCFNSIAWDFNYGYLFTDEVIDEIIESLSPNYINGLTILGGEPLEKENQEDVLKLIKKVKEIYNNKNIWIYTGFTYEQLYTNPRCNTLYINDIINNIDILVDGRFDENKKDISLLFKGSSNQRIIDVKRSLKEGKIVLDALNEKRSF